MTTVLPTDLDVLIPLPICIPTMRESCISEDVAKEDTYYSRNRDTKLKYQTKYHNVNHVEYLTYQHSYYATNRKNILEKRQKQITCDCGRVVSVGHLHKHLKTKIHQNNIQSRG